MIEGQERAYATLLVSANPSFTASLSRLLPGEKFGAVHVAVSAADARRALFDRSFDLVLINSPLPDENGAALAVDASSGSGTVVELFARHESYADLCERLSPYGVFCFSKPAPPQTVASSLDWLCAARERLRRLEKKAQTVEEKMEEIRLVNHAKWILIRELKMEEEEAHRYLEKQAMDRCLSRRDVAEQIIRTYSG